MLRGQMIIITDREDQEHNSYHQIPRRLSYENYHDDGYHGASICAAYTRGFSISTSDEWTSRSSTHRKARYMLCGRRSAKRRCAAVRGALSPIVTSSRTTSFNIAGAHERQEEYYRRSAMAYIYHQHAARASAHDDQHAVLTAAARHVVFARAIEISTGSRRDQYRRGVNIIRHEMNEHAHRDASRAARLPPRARRQFTRNRMEARLYMRAAMRRGYMKAVRAQEEAKI